VQVSNTECRLDCVTNWADDRVVVDDRVPGDSEPRELEYKCDFPWGCTYTKVSLIVPVCPTHHRRMVLNTSEQPPTSEA
jgi:hypothetical protein